MIPAMGCTEPIALAYGAARARENPWEELERIVAKMFRKYHQKCALCDHSQFRRLKGGFCRCDPWGGGRRCLNMEVLSKSMKRAGTLPGTSGGRYL